jgi:broad specificity phosphatase PhoE
VRARQSAEIVASALGAAVADDPRLLEVACTPWEGMHLDEIATHADFVDARRRRVSPPGFEPLAEVQARVVECIESRWPRAGDGPLVLVSHGDVVRAALAHYLGLHLDKLRSLTVDNGSICRLDRAGRHVQIGLINHVPYVAT